MALLDLSMVTTALTSLVRAHISMSPAWILPQPPVVSALPPDQLAAGSLGIYLYHLSEDGYLKNAPPPGPGTVPVRLIPMAVSLHYLVTALGEGQVEQATLLEQRLIGCAARALHDHPVIDDDTVLPQKPPHQPLEVLQQAGLDGAGNRLRISLQPIIPAEASAYWNSGPLSTRLALYYQVTAVLLEPEKPTAATGRVLRYGVQTFAGSAPRLDSAENTVHINVPGLPPQDVVTRPAEVPIGGRITFHGTGLAGDLDSRLVLQHASWAGPVTVDETWSVLGTGDHLSATVQQTAGAETVLPGTYTARIRVIHRRTLPDGSVREIPVLSNSTPFSVAARVTAPALVADAGTVTGGPFRAVGGGLFPPDSIQLSIGGIVLREQRRSGDPLLPGQFRADAADTLRFLLPAGLVPRAAVSLRVAVLGAESPTWWFIP
ncbi:DUF4255 domain-containing protein [Actinoplanes sp. CA-252034]|uniref:DUF4255 domain-containing protein n=1 Tax=Actinoplanes sp. CA-252034 TaxID=3239906 RepID=UPI003D9968C6